MAKSPKLSKASSKTSAKKSVSAKATPSKLGSIAKPASKKPTPVKAVTKASAAPTAKAVAAKAAEVKTSAVKPTAAPVAKAPVAKAAPAKDAAVKAPAAKTPAVIAKAAVVQPAAPMVKPAKNGTTMVVPPVAVAKSKPESAKATKKAAAATPAYTLPKNAVILPAPKPGSVKAMKPAPKVLETKPTKAEAAAVKFPNNAPVPLPPVPTTGKPKKNQAGLSVKELEHYREQLLLKRRELVGDMSSMETEALRSANGTNLSNLPLHMADMGTDNYEQEFTLGLVEKDRNLLREINRALAKIQDGSFGICEGTGKPINKPRLEAQPWAKYSIEYARMMERGLVRR